MKEVHEAGLQRGCAFGATEPGLKAHDTHVWLHGCRVRQAGHAAVWARDRTLAPLCHPPHDTTLTQHGTNKSTPSSVATASYMHKRAHTHTHNAGSVGWSSSSNRTVWKQSTQQTQPKPTQPNSTQSHLNGALRAVPFRGRDHSDWRSKTVGVVHQVAGFAAQHVAACVAHFAHFIVVIIFLRLDRAIATTHQEHAHHTYISTTVSQAHQALLVMGVCVWRVRVLCVRLLTATGTSSATEAMTN